MTKKDYELIARALRAAHYRAVSDSQRAGIDIATNLLADLLEGDNPRFRRARFMAAADLPVDN